MFLNSWREVRALPQPLWVLAAAMLINRLGAMVVPLMVLYVTEGLHLSAATAGAVLSAYGVGALAAAPLAGRLTDRLGAAPMMRWSLVLSGLVLLAFPLLEGEPALFAGTLLLAVLTEGFRPASYSVVSQLVRADQRKAAFALVRLAVNLGMSVGPALGTLLATISFTWVFVADGISTILAGVTLWLLFRPQLHLEKLEDASTATGGHAPATWTQFAWFLLASVGVSLVFFQVHAALPLHLVRNLHFAPTAFGLIFTVNTLIIVAIEVPLNASTAHWSHRRTMGLGALLVATGFGAMVVVEGMPSLLVTVVLWTFGEMLLFPCMGAYVAEISPPARRGTWMGMFTMAFNAGFAVGPAMGTLVLEQFGGTVLWTGAFFLGLGSAAVYARVYTPARQGAEDVDAAPCASESPAMG